MHCDTRCSTICVRAHRCLARSKRTHLTQRAQRTAGVGDADVTLGAEIVVMDSHEAALNEKSRRIIESALKVHSFLGPGLLESAYKTCLAHELRRRGFTVVPEFPISVVYEGVRMEIGYRADLLIDAAIILEIKCVEKLAPIHEAQLLSYVRLSGVRIGLLLNIHELHLKDGIKRKVNNL